jgi:hypothetical protein
MLKLMLLEIKEKEMIFSKLMIVEIDLKNVKLLTIQKTKRKEFQREIHFIKSKIKEIDPSIK